MLNRVKKRVVVALVAALSAAPCIWAQNSGAPLRLGLRVGGGTSWLLNRDDRSTDSTTLTRNPATAFSFGIGVGKNLRRNFGFETGFQYTQLGGAHTVAYRAGGTDTSIATRTDISYFQVPLLAEITANPDAKLQFVGQAGFVLGLINHVRQYVAGERVSDFVIGEHLRHRDLWATAEFSLVGGAGLRYAIADRWEAQAHLRATYSLLDVEDQRYKLQGRAPSRLLTAALVLGVSYRFVPAAARPQPLSWAR